MPVFQGHEVPLPTELLRIVGGDALPTVLSGQSGEIHVVALWDGLESAPLLRGHDGPGPVAEVPRGRLEGRSLAAILAGTAQEEPPVRLASYILPHNLPEGPAGGAPEVEKQVNGPPGLMPTGILRDLAVKFDAAEGLA